MEKKSIPLEKDDNRLTFRASKQIFRKLDLAMEAMGNENMSEVAKIAIEWGLNLMQSTDYDPGLSMLKKTQQMTSPPLESNEQSPALTALEKEKKEKKPNGKTA